MLFSDQLHELTIGLLKTHTHTERPTDREHINHSHMVVRKPWRPVGDWAGRREGSKEDGHSSKLIFHQLLSVDIWNWPF